MKDILSKKDLNYLASIDIMDIESNGTLQCLECGEEITKKNDSGWEGFTENGKTTQPLCVKCYEGR